MKRTPIIAANWKMNLTMSEAAQLTNEIVPKISNDLNNEVILFVGFTHFNTIAPLLSGTTVKLGGQNLHYESQGAYTGEVAAFQLTDAGCSHVLIGHSERRHYFKEDYEVINNKMKQALFSGLSAMLCVGESLQERETGVTEMVVVDQLESAFQDIQESSLNQISIAYEPIWAIGTGKTATPEDANHVHQIIRKSLTRIFGSSAAGAMRILYGGSVKPDNIKDLMQMDDIDGALVGGASLKPDSFSKLIHYDK
jgi:triosephosphate isomerase (TIM)